MKPDRKLNWAILDRSVKEEPSFQKKSTGWVHLERPEAGHWNWLWNVLSQWIDWLNFIPARDLLIEDVGNLYVSDNVEDALQEAKVKLNAKSAEGFQTGVRVLLNQSSPTVGWVIDTYQDISQMLLVVSNSLSVNIFNPIGHSHSTNPKNVSFVIGEDLFSPQGVTDLDTGRRYIEVYSTNTGLSTPYGRIKFYSAENWKRRRGTQIPNLMSVLSTLSFVDIKKVFYIIARKI